MGVLPETRRSKAANLIDEWICWHQKGVESDDDPRSRTTWAAKPLAFGRDLRWIARDGCTHGLRPAAVPRADAQQTGRGAVAIGSAPSAPNSAADSHSAAERHSAPIDSRAADNPSAASRKPLAAKPAAGTRPADKPPADSGAAESSAPVMPADQERAMLDQMFAQRDHRAPSLDGGVGWINTAGPIDLKDLRGKFVVLDFWTYCCINCMHVIPELKKLEHEYPNELVVIGVHSAKFEAEQDSKNIADAVLRYDIEHPVVNDAHQTIWNRYGVDSWPTLVLIDPEGYVLFQNGGEIKADSFDEAFFKKLIPYYRQKGLLDEKPIHFDLAAIPHDADPVAVSRQDRGRRTERSALHLRQQSQSHRRHPPRWPPARNDRLG